MEEFPIYAEIIYTNCGIECIRHIYATDIKIIFKEIREFTKFSYIKILRVYFIN